MTAPVRLPCPACGRLTLMCAIEGTPLCYAVRLLAQDCLCDPWDAWEEVVVDALEYLLLREEEEEEA